MPSLPQINLAYPVHISIGRTENSKFISKSVGSGFYFNAPDAVYLATATHVLFDKGIELYGKEAVLTSIGSDLKSKMTIELDCEELIASKSLKKHVTADVAVAKIGAISTDQKSQRTFLNFVGGVIRHGNPPANVGIVGLPRQVFRRLDQVEISNDVLMFGYPASLGREAQIDRARPLLRRGIVAGKTEDRRLVIDCPTYFGNSGALVIEIEERAVGDFHFHAMGVATEMVPFVEELWSKQFKVQTGVRYENSGYSLVEPMDRVEELL